MILYTPTKIDKFEYVLVASLSAYVKLFWQLPLICLIHWPSFLNPLKRNRFFNLLRIAKFCLFILSCVQEPKLRGSFNLQRKIRSYFKFVQVSKNGQSGVPDLVG